jgi:tetratricopeptide (TPR) repeat protein
MRRARRVLSAVLFVAIAGGSALAAYDWYDFYLKARDEDIPAERWADCVKNLREALRRRPQPGNNVQTYGLQFMDYVPHYYLGLCLLRQEDYPGAVAAFDLSEKIGPIKKSPLHAQLVRLRSEARSAEAARLTRRARGEVQRLLQQGREAGRRGDYEVALARLAEAEALATPLDPDTLRSVTREQERLRTAQKEATDAAARAQRLEQRLADGERLLDEGRPTEAKVAFDEALDLDPRNERGLAGRSLAEERIRASTTRAERQKAFEEGQALFDAGKYEASLAPLTDAAADAANVAARELLARARQLVEGLRRQREIRAEIDRLFARGEELMRAQRWAEAQVAYEGVLRLDAGHARARERQAEAERRTGEALLARWLPNLEPDLQLFEPDRTSVEAPTYVLQGVASDDRGVQKVEFRVGGRLISELVPADPPPAVKFVRELPLEPGPNTVTVTAIDTGGLARSQSFDVARHLRFHETTWFLPSAGAAALGLVGLGFVAQRVRRRIARRRRFNPYIAGAPVLDDRMFYGRSRLTARMLSTLHRNSLMITGERRIGKTTFLHHLKRVLSEDDAGDWRFFPVFVDLQGVPEEAFFHALMAEVVDGLSLAAETRAALRFRPDPAGYDARDFAHDLQCVIAELKTRTDRKVRLALLIDEVDVLNQYSESVNQRLRGIFMKSFSENLVAVMSGVGIRRRWKSEVSPWYNFFDEIELTPLTRDEAEALVREPVSGFFRWQPQAVERILELSQLKPYLVQKFCVHAVNRMLEHGRGTIRLEDVESARSEVESEDARAAAAEDAPSARAVAD